MSVSTGTVPHECAETLTVLARLGYRLDWETGRSDPPLPFFEKTRCVSASLVLDAELTP